LLEFTLSNTAKAVHFLSKIANAADKGAEQVTGRIQDLTLEKYNVRHYA
jgi:hypothetical protein